jgi:hypothetical protein
MPLIGRQVRMSDVEWLMFKELGGADWLRKLIKKKAKLPLQHYKDQNDREQEGIL